MCTDHLWGRIVVCCLVLKVCCATCTDHLFGLIVVCCLVLKLLCHMYRPSLWPYCGVLSCLKTVVPHVQTIFVALLWCAVLS